MASLDLAGAGQTLSTLWECYNSEQAGDLIATEQYYVRLLDQHAKARYSEGITLIHYIDFVRRVRGIDAAIGIIEDLQLAESDQITTDVRIFVSSALKWSHTSATTGRRQAFNEMMDICRSTKGKALVDGSVSVSDFLAFSVNDPRAAIKESVRMIFSRKNASKNQVVWNMWDSVSREFGSSAAAEARKIKSFSHKSDPVTVNADPLFKDESTLLQDDINPEANEVSWLDTRPPAYRLTHKYEFGGNFPDSALLEYLVDPSLIIDDERDGGDSQTNHVYRPDVTKMMRFVPAEDVQRKVEIPRVVRSFAACLPSRGPKGVNATTLAESSLRLLVSISLPRPVSDDMLANVDRRTRLAVEQRRRQAVEARISGAAVAPLNLAKPVTATKEEQTEDFSGVKNEDLGDSLQNEFRKQRR